ncbi:MAG: DegT/DnrJ/EryC1/StrS family aminotransferase [Bacteroidales bacterium]
MNSRIWLSLAHMGGSEQQFIQEAFDTNWVVPLGPNVDGFELDLEKFLSRNSINVEAEKGSLHVTALSAGTAALHLALIQLGVKAGDEVICQSFTFAASANPIVYQGATPVYVDSERDTWNMSPEALEEAIKDRIAVTGKKPKAIIPVHLYGMPAKMDKIMEVASRYEIAVVEDAAEALGSFYKGVACGAFGRFGVLSFNGNKIITTSGGGALVSRSSECKAETMFLATQARDNAPHYQHTRIGYNYRMSNICAGIGRGQMMVLEEHVERRRAINMWYREALKDVKGITFQTEPSAEYFSNYWLTSILVDPKQSGGITREDIRVALNEENIESRPLWKPMHMQPVFESAPYYGSGVAEELFENGLCLPSHPMLNEQDLERVVKVIKSLIK